MQWGHSWPGETYRLTRPNEAPEGFRKEMAPGLRKWRRGREQKQPATVRTEALRPEGVGTVTAVTKARSNKAPCPPRGYWLVPTRCWPAVCQLVPSPSERSCPLLVTAGL